MIWHEMERLRRFFDLSWRSDNQFQVRDSGCNTSICRSVCINRTEQIIGAGWLRVQILEVSLRPMNLLRPFVNCQILNVSLLRPRFA